MFLSKEERAQLALKRLQQKGETIRSQRDEQRSAFFSSGNTSSRDAMDVKRDGKRPLNDDRNTVKPLDEESRKDVIDLDENELQVLRDRYMGIEKKKRRVRRMNDKKFVFDWDATDDTSKDFNPIYAKRHEAQLFGRGLIAGIDAKTQKKERAAFYDHLLQQRRTELEKDRAYELDRQQHRKERQKAFDDRHWSEKPLEEMKDRDWRIFKEDFNISTKGGNIPNPIREWKDSNLPPRILSIVASLGYKEPTPIQRQAIPLGLQNRDLIGVAETGSGKTASFVIPMLVFMAEMPPLTEENISQGPFALILAPTRELAQQIETETMKFAKELGYTCVSIIGGHSIEEQAFGLRNGAHIIISTPGRLKDLLDRRILVFSQCTYVVMDEADRMVDMGFEADLNVILDAMPLSNMKPDSEDAEDIERLRYLTGTDKHYRQTVMFSATMPPAVERLAKQYLRRPATVTIGVAGQIVDRIEQRVEMINDESKKMARLQSILTSEAFEPPIIVFVRQKRSCDSIARAFDKLGFRCTTLHGGKSQEQRELSLSGLKEGTKDILIATDVAGRGIDVKNVSLVVNFDMAKNIEDYTHRIGRTGRAGKEGVAITFLSNTDTDVMYDLKQMLEKSSKSTIPVELMKHEVKPNHFSIIFLFNNQD